MSQEFIPLYELKTPRTKFRNEWRKCECCGTIFERDTIKFMWRLKVTHSINYLNGGFWTTHCEKCFKEHINLIAESFTALRNRLHEMQFM